MGKHFLHRIGHYPILQPSNALASQLPMLDLSHLSFASRHCHAHVLSSPEFDSFWKRQCFYDGRGLQRRLDYYMEGPRRLQKPWRRGDLLRCWNRSAALCSAVRRGRRVALHLLRQQSMIPTTGMTDREPRYLKSVAMHFRRTWTMEAGVLSRVRYTRKCYKTVYPTLDY